MAIPGTVLRTFDILQHLDAPSLAHIRPLFSTQFCTKGQFIVSARSQSTDVFFLVSGRVRVCFFSDNGKLIQFEDLSPGKMFGELAAIDNQGRSSDCMSVTECQLALLSRQDFRQLIATHASVRDAVLNRLAAMVRSNMRRVYEFSAYSVPQRIRFELLRLASESQALSNGTITLDQVPTHAEIAARVSTHREAVTRELKSLEARGIITWKPSKHAVHDVVRLSENQ